MSDIMPLCLGFISPDGCSGGSYPPEVPHRDPGSMRDRLADGIHERERAFLWAVWTRTAHGAQHLTVATYPLLSDIPKRRLLPERMFPQELDLRVYLVLDHRFAEDAAQHLASFFHQSPHDCG